MSTKSAALSDSSYNVIVHSSCLVDVVAVLSSAVRKSRWDIPTGAYCRCVRTPNPGAEGVKGWDRLRLLRSCHLGTAGDVSSVVDIWGQRVSLGGRGTAGPDTHQGVPPVVGSSSQCTPQTILKKMQD